MACCSTGGGRQNAVRGRNLTGPNGGARGGQEAPGAGLVAPKISLAMLMRRCSELAVAESLVTGALDSDDPGAALSGLVQRAEEVLRFTRRRTNDISINGH